MKKLYAIILFVIGAINGMAQCPAVFTVSTGGTVCSGTTVSLTLNGSETGVNYQLKSGGTTDVGSVVAGTGSAVTWNLTLTATATYTIVATHSTSGCSQTMTGSAVFTVLALPNANITNTSGGTVLTCYITPLLFTGSSSTAGASFSWTGPGGFTSNVAQIVVTSPGVYTLKVASPSSGCIAIRTKTVTQTLVPPATTATVSGIIQCADQFVTLQTISGTPVTYSWTGPASFTSSIKSPSVSVPGVYNVTVTTPGNCTGNASITVNAAADISLPNLFTVSGGGTICANASSTISMSGSQTGVNYQLKLNDANYGNSVSGTGGSLNWNNLAAPGTYTVVGANASSGCTQTMTGSGTITTLSSPAVFTMGGGGIVQSYQALPITLSGSEIGVNYQLKSGTKDVGSVVAGTGSALTLANQTTAGIYTAVATSGTGCSQTMTGSSEIKNPAQTLLDNLAFQYKYDARKRMIAKKIPGADWVYMVYDKRDRLVMTQDGEQRKANKWAFITYDAFNRPIITGIYTHTSSVDQAVMSGLISTANFFETYTDDAANHGYSNTVFQATDFPGIFEALTVTYYDNYNFRSLWTGTYGYASDGLSATVANGATYTQPAIENLFVIGLVTGTKVKVLDGGTAWLKSISYYDNKYRVIQAISDNIEGGIDRMSNLYDFVGKVLKTKTTHTISSGTTQNIVRIIEYDHASRPTKTWHSINNQTPVLLTKNEYNELGQLVTKKLHSTNGETGFKQSIDYRYNIRGWLKSINDVVSPEPADLFSMNLNYNTPTSNGGIAQYNGNISEILWKGSDAKTNSYGYYYDPMNRLTEAKYYNASVPTQNGRFDEKIWDVAGNKPGYDLNGNIQQLTRFGKNGIDAIGITTYGQMDNIAYAYQGNQLLSVTETGTGIKTEGFIDGTNTGDDYTYDANGNMIHDLNKGIGSTLSDNANKITYNHLNLPERVQKSPNSYVQYVYDATGRKLQQVAVDNGGSAKTTDYAGEFIYENNALQFINHEEGRVVMTGSQPEYQYHLKDHLGNVRVTFTTRQETESPKATLETSNQESDIANFVRYDKARKIKSNLFDYTNGLADGFAQRLNGTENEKFGIARSLSVMPGDKITAEVYAKYIDTNPTNVEQWLTTLITQISMGTAAAGTVVDGGNYANSTSSFPYTGLLPKGNYTGTGPKAYLNWLVFDRDHNQIPEKCGYYRIGTTSNPRETGQNVDHERLFSPEITIDQAGFVYIYLSNEESSPVEVFFDDFEVTQIKSPVVTSNDYYPFGLTFNSYRRENSLHNKYQFNGKEIQNELDLGWNDFGARMYSPDIGRWSVIDPYSSIIPSITCYNYGFNNPINFIEKDGKIPIPLITGGIGALAGIVYGLATGKTGKEILGLAAGGFVAGATLGFGTAAVGLAGGATSLAAATFSQAAVGSASIGLVNTGYVTIATGVVGNMLGELTQQAIDGKGFDKNDIVLNGVFGLSEVVLGPVADAITQPIKTTLKEGLTESFKTTMREERNYKKELTKQLMQAAEYQGITKKEAARAAEKLISVARETNQQVLDATVKISDGSVEVILNTGTTAAGETIEENN